MDNILYFVDAAAAADRPIARPVANIILCVVKKSSYLVAFVGSRAFCLQWQCSKCGSTIQRDATERI